MRKKAFGETHQNIEGSRVDEEQRLESEPIEAHVEQVLPGHAVSPPVAADATTEPVVIETAPSRIHQAQDQSHELYRHPLRARNPNSRRL